MSLNHPLYYLSVNAAHNDDYHSRPTEAMTIEPTSRENDVYTYALNGYEANVKVNCRPFDENTYESTTTVHNTGKESLILDRISSDVTAYPLPVFVMGDFNATPDSRCIETFRSFKNPSLTDLTSGIPTTFHDFGNRNDNFKIDYIFASSSVASDCTEGIIWDKTVNGMYLSDHYPVEISAKLG